MVKVTFILLDVHLVQLAGRENKQAPRFYRVLLVLHQRNPNATRHRENLRTLVPVIVIGGHILHPIEINRFIVEMDLLKISRIFRSLGVSHRVCLAC